MGERQEVGTYNRRPLSYRTRNKAEGGIRVGKRLNEMMPIGYNNTDMVNPEFRVVLMKRRVGVALISV